MHNDVTRLSKFLSLILRHKPETVGLTLDEQGWVDVDELLVAMNSSGTTIDRALLHHIVDTNDKKRFMFSDDGSRIRASQGHSLSVDLALTPVQPPDVLYHGTASRFLASIREQGLLPDNRQYVHLSRDLDTAYSVGSRYGKPVILTIDAKKMYRDSYLFYRSDNGVWLTASVPVQYISFET